MVIVLKKYHLFHFCIIAFNSPMLTSIYCCLISNSLAILSYSSKMFFCRSFSSSCNSMSSFILIYSCLSSFASCSLSCFSRSCFSFLSCSNLSCLYYSICILAISYYSALILASSSLSHCFFCSSSIVFFKWSSWRF